MKKLFLMLVSLFMVVGCSCSNDKAADAVEKYLNDYKGLGDTVLKDIDGKEYFCTKKSTKNTSESSSTITIFYPITIYDTKKGRIYPPLYKPFL